MAVANKPFKIGKYEVIERLGGGGMGDVYKAVDPRIGRTVAIKVIKGDFDQDPELLRRFDIEARAVGNLEHPNIVAVFEFGEENGIPYLVMPYLDGIPLDKVIAQRQNLEVIQKLDIIIGVLKALDYAHEHRVIHRDVKPANVHLLKDGSVKLLDFGIAREGDVSLTKTKQVMGTLSYMPPEQMNMEVVDRRGDIFSTGIILFELLTYSLPFEARDQASIIVQRLKGDPPPPLSKYFDNYPLELDDIIARALMRDREERYSRAEDFAFDLTRVQERLKREKASHCVDQARALIAKSDLLKARDLLSEVIRIDTQNSTAKQLYYEVQQLLQAQQRVERVQRLRTQAEDALAAKQLQNAADLVEQAIKIDKNDLSLLDLREQIQEARARSEQVLMLLQRASDAQQSEQFEMAQKFVADALVLDPSDTGAKFMQATIARQLVEQEKRNRIQQLLQVARREISARQYEAARENINKAKAIDPAHPEIPGLEKMVVAGQQQERRNAELQQVCAEIERRLLDNNLAAARELAGNSLRKFPLEERLIRLKIAADEAYEQEERRIYIEQQIVLASRLVDDGQPSSALKLLQEAERLYPDNTRLLEYMKVVREAATQETAEHERNVILIRARAAIRRKSLDEAIGTLEQGLVRFPADAEIRELLETVHRDAELLNQNRQVKEVTKRAQDLLASREHTDAIRLLEQTSAQIPDPDLLRLLEYARKQAADYRTGLSGTSEQAKELLNSGQHSEALAFLEKEAATYSRSAEFQELLAQAHTRVRELEQTRQRMLRNVNDARAALEAGDSLRAAAILKPTVAEFPAAPEVQALAAEISRVRQAFEHQREEAQKQALVPPSAQETKRFPSTGSEAHATSLFSPEVGPVTAKPDIHPGADTEVPSLATDVFAPQQAAPEVQRPPSAGESAASREGPQPQLTRKKKPTDRAGTAEAAEPVSEAAAQSPVLKQRTVEPPVSPTPTPPPIKKLAFIALGVLVLLVSIVVVIKVITGGKPNEAYLKVTAIAGGKPLAGAELIIDGQSAGTAAADGAISAKVTPGNRSLEVRAEGYVTRFESVSVSAGERKPIEVKLQIEEVRKPPSVEQGTLVVQSSDTDAEVLIDNQPRGVIGRDRKLTIKADPGKHRVQLKKSGYQDSSENTVDIAANKSSNLSFRPLVVIPGKTAIVIDSSPRGALVRIDHKPAGTTANGPLKTKVDAGLHPVEVSKDGYDTWTRDVTVEKDQELPVTAKLSMAALPSISSFSASPSLIKKGDRTQLAWVTQNATEITIDNGLGVVQSPTGTREVRPIETTTYLLTAKGRGGTSTSQVTVNVAVPSQPTIQFAPLDAVILKKGKTTLKWSVENASEVSIDQGIGKVPVRGERDVNPEDTTTYTLTAEGPGGTKKAMAIVTVNVPSAPVIVFKPTDSSIQKGQSTKLQWTVQNANEVSIDQGIGKVMANGERDVSPRETKIYTLTASWPGGEKRQSITITVNPRPPGVEDKPTITSLLRQFNDAVKDHNGKAIREHWPTIPKPVYDAYTSKLAQQVLEDNCPGDPTFGQDSAEWTCNETLTPVVDGKAQKALNQSYVFKFRRSGETWQIVSKTLVK